MRALDFEAEFSRLADAVHQGIERSGLRVAAWQLGDGCDVESFLVSLDYYVEMAGHQDIQFHSSFFASDRTSGYQYRKTRLPPRLEFLHFSS
jgi:hypothetical protein